MMQDFEELFGDFIDSEEYEEAEGDEFALARIAFAAGWQAAGGKLPDGFARRGA